MKEFYVGETVFCTVAKYGDFCQTIINDDVVIREIGEHTCTVIDKYTNIYKVQKEDLYKHEIDKKFFMESLKNLKYLDVTGEHWKNIDLILDFMSRKDVWDLFTGTGSKVNTNLKGGKNER